MTEYPILILVHLEFRVINHNLCKFNGSQYEGYTMIPMIDDFRQRFSFGDDFVDVADSGLMNKNNVELLQQAGYRYSGRVLRMRLPA